MDISLNRREWIKNSALATVALAMGTREVACYRESAPAEQPPVEEELIRLNSNESSFGISPQAVQAYNQALGRSHRYPHRQYPELRSIIAERENLTPNHIVLGAGSTEVMNMILRFCQPQGEVLSADPTYFDFVYYAEAANCPLHTVPLNDRFEHDLSGMTQQLGSHISLVYICNPNNPTGSITPQMDLRAFVESASEKTLVLVDEAYHDYVEDSNYASMIDLVRKNLNVVVTRTFSKIYGMAGLRIGYGVAKPEIIRELRRMRMNFASIAYPSLQVAIAGYLDMDYTGVVMEKNQDVKAYLYNQLEKLKLYYIPSHTNFVLFRISRDARDMAAGLLEKGVLVRPFTFAQNNWIRVSIGTMAEMQSFTSILASVL